MKERSLLFSQDYAKILKVAWQKGNIVTSEDAASILYCAGKVIPIDQRSRLIRNAVMTLTRMQNDGLIVGILKDKKTRMRKFKVVSKDDLRTRISKDLKMLFGDNF